MRVLRQLLILSSLAAVLTVGLAVASASAVAGLPLSPCICPKIFAPVRCDDGREFANQCIADCFGATNCVVVGVPFPRP